MINFVNYLKNEKGMTLLFIAALGDNFYWNGMGTCDTNGGG